MTLKDEIKQREKSLEQVARACEVSYGTVQGWLKGAIPGLEKFLMLALCLEMPIEDLCRVFGLGSNIDLLHQVTTKNSAQE